MGTLDIRQSSEGVRGLGQFRMPELGSGAAGAFEAQSRAALAAADAARTAGRAATEGIARRGQIVAHTLEGLGRLALDFADRENARVATNAILAKRQERNLFMYGDGTEESPGQFNVQFDDARRWLDGLREENVRMDERHTKDLNAAQRRIYREAMDRDEVEWQLRIGSHAAKRTLQAQTATAVAETAQARDDAVLKFAEPEFRDAKVRAFYEAKEREMDVRGLSEGERRLELKSATEDFLTVLATRTFRKWAGETAGSDDPEAVRAAWDAKAKALGGLGGEVPANADIREALGSDALDEAHRTLLAGRFAQARDRAVSDAQSLRSQNLRKAQDGLVMREQELYKEPPPEDADGAVGGMTAKAMAYEGFADEAEKAGLGRAALSYRRTAAALREGARDYAARAERERLGEERALRQETYERTAAEFDLGGYYGADGEWRDETAWERQERAALLYREGKVGYRQMCALMAKTRPEVDGTFQAVRGHVLDTLDRLVPAAVRYSPRTRGFEVSPTAKVRGSTETGYKWASESGRESVTYAQVVEAMNLAVRWGRERNASVDDINAKFDSYATDAVRRQQRMTVEKRLEYDRAVLDDFRNMERRGR